MKIEKIIDKKLKEFEKNKKKLEKDYDDLLSTFTKKGRELENHDSYTRVLNVTFASIELIKEKIKLLEELKKEAQ